MEQMGAEFVRALKGDRRAVLTTDTIRSLVFVLLSATLIWLYIKQKANKNLVIAGFVILILADLIPVDRRYVNNDDFVAARTMNQPFQQTAADAQILQDPGHFRVFDLAESPFNTGRTSYFHNSIGGYHAAKPGRIQELYDFYISRNNMEILNMLNVKYFIIPTEEGVQAQQNPEAFGNAWLVNEVNWAENANEAILSLGETKLDSAAVIHVENKNLVPTDIEADPSAKIELISQQPNELVYKSNASKEQLAVFSEIYYPNGWKATIGGKESDHFRVNYVLRGMMIPAGEHEIRFKFEPEVVKTGSIISLSASILLGLLLLGGLFYKYKRK